MRVLVLGGTRQGRMLADRVVARGDEVVSSLAGRTSDALLPAGEVRIGGFGGIDGLADWLTTNPVDAVVDATHPFAEQMHANAFAACRRVGVPMVHFGRPSWATRPDAADWVWVDSHEEACSEAGRLGGRVLLTIGRQQLASYHRLSGLDSVLAVTARVAEDDGAVHPSGWHLLVERGPFAEADEEALLARHDVLVTKDSGGLEGTAKLDAAARLQVRVVMIGRRPLPGPVLTSADEVVDWLDHRTRR